MMIMMMMTTCLHCQTESLNFLLCDIMFIVTNDIKDVDKWELVSLTLLMACVMQNRVTLPFTVQYLQYT